MAFSISQFDSVRIQNCERSRPTWCYEEAGGTDGGGQWELVVEVAGETVVAGMKEEFWGVRVRGGESCGGVRGGRGGIVDAVLASTQSLWAQSW